MATPERRYALIKIKAGDYLLPANDGKTLWRVKTYEDGPSHGLMDMERDQMFWGVWRWEGNPIVGTIDVEEIVEIDRWRMVATHHRTRRQAIDAALRAEADMDA